MGLPWKKFNINEHWEPLCEICGQSGFHCGNSLTRESSTKYYSLCSYHYNTIILRKIKLEKLKNERI